MAGHVWCGSASCCGNNYISNKDNYVYPIIAKLFYIKEIGNWETKIRVGHWTNGQTMLLDRYSVNIQKGARPKDQQTH